MPAVIPWCRAVWREGEQEEEGVIPFNWVVGKHVLWPSCEKNERKILMEQKEPNVKEWEHFDLIKIKITSDNKKECDEYNFTTSAEMSDEEETQELLKRQPKKKNFSDFVTGDVPDGPSTSGRSKSNLNVTVSAEELPPPPPPPIVEESAGANSTKSRQSSSKKKKADKVAEVYRSESSRSPSPTYTMYMSSPEPSPSTSRGKKPASRKNSDNFRREKHQMGTSKKRSSQNSSYMESPRSPTPMTDSSNSRTPSPETFRTSGKNKQKGRRDDRGRAEERGRVQSRSRSPVRRSRSRQRSSSRPNSQQKEIKFPLTEAKFQKRTLYLLCEIRDILKRKTPAFVQGLNDNLDLEQTDTIEEFRQLDRSLKDKDTYCKCKSMIAKIGGCDYKDHLKKAMKRCMTNGLMSMMNMKGKHNKFPFAKTNLFKLFKEVFLACYDTTESQLADVAAKYLKFAPERVGGGGRREQEQD